MRRNLALLVLATTSAVVIGVLLPLAVLIRQMAMDRAIASADQDARSIAVAAAVVGETDQLRRLVNDTNQRSGRTLSVTLPSGTVLGPQPPADRAYAAARRGVSLRARHNGGEEVFVPVVTRAGQTTVRSFVPHDLLLRGVNVAWTALLLLGICLLAMSAAVADRTAKWLVRPINQLIGVTEQISAGRLDARVPTTGPREIVTLAVAFNRLAGRIGELVAAERELVADLSHRLRTPITALRLDADAGLGAVDGTRLAAHVSTLERTVDDIINAARRPLRNEIGATVDVVAVVRERLAFWRVLAEDQNRRAEAHLPSHGVLVRASAADVTAAIDALLENVFAHTDDGAGFDIYVEPRADGGAAVIVTDEGPGLSSDELGERGRSTRGSTGLGLDIVRRTAEGAGGKLWLANLASGGAVITAEFGAPDLQAPISRA
jgi:signal transduction histidine kinase